MYLKEFEIRNFRKFYYKKDNKYNRVSFSNPHKIKDINIAARTSLVLGANNSGKTTIIACLETLLSSNPSFSGYDFNLDYISNLFNSYSENPDDSFDPIILPEMSFVFRVELDDNDDDLVNNIAPFLKISNLDDKIVEIYVKWEIKEKEVFVSKLREINKSYKDYCLKKGDECKKKLENDRFQLLSADNFQLNYYNSSMEQVKNFKIANLIKIKSIKANKIDSDKCLSNALRKIIKFRYDSDKENANHHTEFNNTLFDTAEGISSDLGENYTRDINDTFNSIISSHKVGMRVDLDLDTLMNNLVKCEYLENEKLIPENQYGLGYTNLVMIISEIISYIDNYHNEQRNSQINLITIEEPETYMHPQMQELFIKRIDDTITKLLKGKHKNVNSQLMITTHSSHILNSKIHSGASFDNINYIRCSKGYPEIVILSDENIISAEGKAEELMFIKKHIKFKVSELFFAEAAIFVEGITEYYLLQYYLDKDSDLNTRNISVVLIDGNHAKVYEQLIKSLGIPVVIVTDLDIERTKQEKGKDKDENPNFTQIDNLTNRKSTNSTLQYFYGEENDLSKIKDYVKQDNLMVCSQIHPINGFYATSFEEAFILTNTENEILNSILQKIKPEIYEKCSHNNKVNKNQSYELQCKLAKDKSRFANEILYKILTNEDNGIKLPQYLEASFSFLKKKLGETK